MGIPDKVVKLMDVESSSETFPISSDPSFSTILRSFRWTVVSCWAKVTSATMTTIQVSNRIVVPIFMNSTPFNPRLTSRIIWLPSYRPLSRITATMITAPNATCYQCAKTFRRTKPFLKMIIKTESCTAPRIVPRTSDRLILPMTTAEESDQQPPATPKGADNQGFNRNGVTTSQSPSTEPAVGSIPSDMMTTA